MKFVNVNCTDTILYLYQNYNPKFFNLIPATWWKNIRLETGRVDTNAIILLSELVGWFTPREVEKEGTNTVYLEKKFLRDWYQVNYATLEEKLGLTKRQLQEAFYRLNHRYDLIEMTTKYKDPKTGKTILNNTFVNLKAEEVVKFTVQEIENVPRETLKRASRNETDDLCVSRNIKKGLESHLNGYIPILSANNQEGEEKAPPSPPFSFGEGNEEVEEFINLWNSTLDADRPERISKTTPEVIKTISQYIENNPEWRDYLEDGIRGYLSSKYALEAHNWSYLFKFESMLWDKALAYRSDQTKSLAVEDSEPDEYNLTLQDYAKGKALVKLWVENGMIDKTDEFQPVVSHTLHQFLKAGYKLVPHELSFKVVSDHYSKSFDVYGTSAVYAKMAFDQFIAEEKRIIANKERHERAKDLVFSDKVLPYCDVLLKTCNVPEPKENEILSPKFKYFIVLKVNKRIELEPKQFESGTHYFSANHPLKEGEKISIFPYINAESETLSMVEVLEIEDELKACPHLLTKS